MNQRLRHLPSITAATTGAVLLLFAQFARADSDPTRRPEPRAGWVSALTLKLEPGGAFAVSEPQTQRVGAGGSVGLKLLWPLGRFVDVGPSATFLALSNGVSDGESGRAWAFGPSLRLKRPHRAAGVDPTLRVSPWIDADLSYVRTGELDRAGFAVGAGVAFPIGSARALWLGPFVRYSQILQADEAGFDDRDAKLLSVGVSLELGAPAKATCRDRDGDGVCDLDDRCRSVAGTAENLGCPPYKLLVVRPDRLELKERLYFEWDQAVIEAVSYPVLDEVVQALRDNTGFRVQVEGHASSEGAYDHNQALSEKRAAAVLDYLATHGIGKERLVAKGFSSSVPVASNLTEAGREQNRRVEFVVHFIILEDGSN